MSIDLDESELLQDLQWIADLEAEQSYLPTPRYVKPPASTTAQGGKIVSWWDFGPNEAALREWDEEIQFYDETNDNFRKWTSKYGINFNTISLLRSLQLDDIPTLKKINRFQYCLLQHAEELSSSDYATLIHALRSLPNDLMFAEDDELFAEDDDIIVVNEHEFNLRPRLARNLPHRRSTRTAKRSHNIHIRSDGTKTLPRQRLDNSNRRLSWETFTFFNPKTAATTTTSIPVPDLKTRSPIEKAFSSGASAFGTLRVLRKSADKYHQMSEKNQRKTFFPSVTPI